MFPIEIEIVEGDLPFQESEWVAVGESYQEMHLSYIQYVLALSNLLYIDVSKTPYEEFEMRLDFAEDAAKALETSTEGLEFVTDPMLEIIGEVNKKGDKIQGQEKNIQESPIASFEYNTEAVILRLKEMARRNPDKARHAFEVINTLRKYQGVEYMKDAEINNELMLGASKIKLASKTALAITGAIATGGSSTLIQVGGGTSVIVSFTDAKLTYMNERNEVIYGPGSSKIEIPKIVTTLFNIVGVLSGNPEEIGHNIIISFGDDLANLNNYLSNKAMEIIMPSDFSKHTRMLIEALELPADHFKPDHDPPMPPLFKGNYFEEPGDNTKPITIKEVTEFSEGIIKEIKDKLSNNLLSSVIDELSKVKIPSVTIDPDVIDTKVGEVVSFTAIGKDSPTNVRYDWDFGDGKSA